MNDVNRKIRDVSEFFGGNAIVVSVMRRLFDYEPNLSVPNPYRTVSGGFEIVWSNETAGLSFDNEGCEIGCFFYTDEKRVMYHELDKSLSIAGWVYDKLNRFIEE